MRESLAETAKNTVWEYFVIHLEHRSALRLKTRDRDFGWLHTAIMQA
jgi:hypothetical protein